MLEGTACKSHKQRSVSPVRAEAVREEGQVYWAHITCVGGHYMVGSQVYFKNTIEDSEKTQSYLQQILNLIQQPKPKIVNYCKQKSS